MFRHHGMHLIEGVGDDTDNGSSATADDTKEPAQVEAVDTDDATTAADRVEKAEVDWKAMSRKHEAEAKRNRAAAAELEKIKAKSRTAEDNAKQAAADAKAEAEAAKAEAAVERAARKHGLTDDKDLEVLQGLPADKVEAVAKAIAAGKKTAAGASGTEVGGGKGAAKPATLQGALGAHYSK